MAATKTVSQLPQSYNSVTPRPTVITLFGYGIQARVDRGHLVVEDGIGADRRKIRLPRSRTVFNHSAVDEHQEDGCGVCEHVSRLSSNIRTGRCKNLSFGTCAVPD